LDEKLVNLAEKAIRQREAAFHTRKAVVERTDVVQRLRDLRPRNARCVFMLEEEELRERALSALDLRGENSLLADIGVEELIWVGEQQRDAVETPERLVRAIREVLQRCHVERRSRRQRLRVENEVRLVAGRDAAE
jgi:hypothetical protein